MQPIAWMTMRSTQVLVAGAFGLAACSGGDRTVATFCEQIITMQSIDEQLTDVDLSDSDAVLIALTAFRDEFDALAEASPAAIADDAETVARFGVTLAEAAIASDPDDSFDRAALLAAAAASDPDIDVAFERVATFASRNCTSAPKG